MTDGTWVASLDEIPPGHTKKFVLSRAGQELEAFVVNHRGNVVAYVNRCCHIPMTMDWVDNQFLSDDGDHILCATHGALYDPATGLCIAGPPLGRCLTTVPVELRDGHVYAGWPAGE
jgi:nitrite reductase/ring-hydroxylating ferredoxin subunit